MAKIAIIDLLFNWPPDGGARTDIRQIAVSLSPNHQVAIFCPDYRTGFPRGRIAQDPGVFVRKIPFEDYEFQPRTLGSRFRKAIDEFKPDWVFIADGWYFKPYVAAAMQGYRRILRFYAHESLCPKSHGHFMDGSLRLCQRNWLENWRDFLPCVLCAHKWLHEDPRVEHFRIPFFRSLAFLPHYPRLVKRVLRSVDMIICYNEFIAGKLRPYNDNVQITPSGIDASRFQASDAPRDGGPIRILMAGRKGDPLKGYDTLFRAVAPLVQNGFDIRLFVTEAPARDEGFVTFTGWLDQDGLAELYRKMDICVVPSVWPEPFGIVALEAMASERPVIVTRVGGLQHIVADGIDGFVVDSFDAQALREKIIRLIN